MTQHKIPTWILREIAAVEKDNEETLKKLSKNKQGSSDEDKTSK